MIVYKFEDILEISKNDISHLNIDISNFIKNYHLIERIDKYEPIFSSTTKYKSFPINSKRPTKNFFQNNKWKIKNVDTNKINQDIKLLLNKLSKNNIDKIKLELIDILLENYNENIIKIFTKELLNKIWFDEILINEYIYICNEIWISPKFKNNIIKYEMINNFLNEFNNRDNYIEKIESDVNDDNIFILKRKLYGTIDLLSKLYINKHISNDDIKDILNKILNNNMTIYDFESFHIIWSVIKDNNYLQLNDILYYKNRIKEQLKNFNNKRLKLLIEIILENTNDVNDNILYINNCLKDYRNNNNLEETYTKLIIIDKEIVLNEIIITQFDNDFSFIDLIKLFDTKLIENVINNLNIEELILDIPNINEQISLLKNILIKK